MWQFLHRSIRRTGRQALPTFPAPVRVGGWFQVLMMVMPALWSTCSIAGFFPPDYDGARGIPSGDFRYTYNRGIATITEYTGAADAVRIPDTLDSLPVSGIEDFCVKDGSGITSLAIPAGVTNVNWRAFASCGKLENIIVDPAHPVFCSIDGDVFSRSMTDLVYVPPGRAGVYAIPGSVSRVREFAFAGNTKLSRVRIPGSVRNIEMYAFGGKTCLQEFEVAPDNPNYRSVDGILYNHKGTLLLKYPPMREGDFSVPDGVVVICPNACADALGLKHLAIPSSVSSIDWYAFSGCLNLKSLNFAEGITEIGPWAFRGCEGLTVVELPASLIRIGGSAFEGCARLEKVSLPPALETIGEMAFQNCNRLRSLHLAEGVILIGRYAFRNCTSLEEVRLPPKLRVLKTGLFSGCTSLASVAISPGVTNIEEHAFSECAKQTRIHVDANNPVYTDFDGVLYSRDMGTLVHFPAGRAGDYSVPESVNAIGPSAFSGCTGLVHVTLPADLAHIGRSAFSECVRLERVTVRKNILAHDRGTSARLDVESVSTGSPPASIGYRAYAGCIALSVVDIPEQITHIEDSAFARCSELHDITLPSGLVSMGSHAFENCSNLTNVRIPASVKRMGLSVFQGCSGLRGVNVDPGSKSYCDVKGVLFNSPKTAILYAPPSLGDVYVIPEGVKSVVTHAFNGCTGLNQMIIPGSVYFIGADALGCANLKAVYFRGKAPAADGKIFGDTSGVVVHRTADAPGWPDAGEKWQGMPSVLWDGKNPVSAEAGVEKSPR